MANQASNHYKYLLNTKQIDLDNDTFIIILMQSGFTFDKDGHALYADVVASELPTGNGYTQNTKTLVPAAAVTEDDVNDRSEVVFDPVSWTAGGGPIGPTCGAIILDSTLGGSPVCGFLDFGGDYTQADGGVATLNDIALRTK